MEQVKTSQTNSDKSDQWFNELILNLKVDQLLYQSDVMSEKKKEVYEALISKDKSFLHSYARDMSSQYFIKNLIDAYFLELNQRSAKPNRLAFELSNSKVLVWAEIINDDEVTEDALILSSAKVNSLFSQYGFHISTTIVEQEDQISVPNHYQEVEINKN